MKNPQGSRTVSILWRVSVCAWIGVGLYWFYLSYISRFSAEDVHDEGRRVVTALEEYKSARGQYPRRLEDTSVAEQKFPKGVAFAYSVNESFQSYVLVVSGGGHTWRYFSAMKNWQHVPPGAERATAPAE
ncbi:hypothetical protein [Frigoriglobus tundricola]|uniref:Type II secretion system protein GspG C-terminal domain-containing protein n=1 Tax=Frigoriglobus tundricola TaxID=2774151 RepID=A0A6M5YLS9_9BACT|nr:hypothetical protein [Frigoriglobus tundricola]QJW94875.1 hypothetical protein FTUN_2401 [Frigoriglobus tundricola]